MFSDHCSNWLCAGALAVLAAMHPWAATGAAFGCCFFLVSPNATRGLRRLALGAFSWGLGYASGVFAYPKGPPYDPSAMLPAAAVAALAVVVFTAFYSLIERDGPLPAWLESILDRIPVLKRKGDADGL